MSTQTQSWMFLTLAAALVAVVAVSFVGSMASVVADTINADLARIASDR